MKVCKVCNIDKELECYQLAGKGYRRGECKTCFQAYKKNKRAQFTAYEAQRRVKGNVQLSDKEKVSIKVIYGAAAFLRSLGQDVVVDHIDPVRGMLVCGFTCPNNLAIISKEANALKSNNFTPYRVTWLPDGSQVTQLV